MASIIIVVLNIVSGGGSCDPGSSGTSDAFYPGTMTHTNEGLSEHTNFDSLITGKN